MRAVIVILAVGTLGVAGCGGGGDKGAPATEKTAAPPAAAGKATESADADIKDFEYVPSRLTVAAGGKVSWTNEDSANHSVTFRDKSLKSIGNLRNGQKLSVAFDKPGEYAYVCTYHPNMHGTVVVK